MKTSSGILILIICYFISLVIIDAYFELQSFNVYNVCLYRDEAKQPNVIFITLTTLIPVIVLLISSIYMDTSCYMNVITLKTSTYQDVQENMHRRNILNAIPFRASMISSVLFVMLLLGYSIIGIEEVEPLEKYLCVIIICRLNDIFRNPLLATCAFRVNNENRQKNADEERERKRKLEIDDALKRRHERKNLVQENECVPEQIPLEPI